MQVTGERKPEYLEFASRVLGVNYKLDNVKMISHVDDQGNPHAVVLFTNSNNSGCEMSIASNGKWIATNEFIRECFYYPFVTCGFNRVHSVVEKQNTQALQFNARIGFVQEAFLNHWFDLNNHGILLVMFKRDCQWLRRKQ